MSGEEDYFRSMDKGIEGIKNYPSDEIILLHHNDTDGLASGTILCQAFKNEGYDVKRFSLEKPYPEVLKKLFSEEKGKVIVFADFAGKIAPDLCRLNREENLVVILDHHKGEVSFSDHVINLYPDLYGIRGDRDISASVACWYFSVRMNSKNKNLAHIGALGGIADFYYLDGTVRGFNRRCFEEAVKSGTAKSRTENGKEKFFIVLGDKEYDVAELYPMLDTIGAAGFYSGGPGLAVDMLLNGIAEEDKKEADKFLKMKNEKFASELKFLKERGLYETEHIQWFDLKDRFAPMGVKSVGLFCEELLKSDLINKDKYLAGYQVVPDGIPGFGKLGIDKTKISVRASSSLTEKIFKGEMPGSDELLPQAVLDLGGFADASHRVSSAAVIKRGEEKILIDEMELVLERLMKRR